MFGKGLGAPGTRVTKRQTERSELLLYLKQAILGALAVDFVIACLLIILVCFGWPSLVVFSVVGTYMTCWLLLNKTSLWLVVDRADLLDWQKARLVWAFVFSLTLGALVFSRGWWEWLLCADVLRAAIAEAAKPLKLSMWVWGGLIALWFLSAVRKIGTLTAIFIVLMLIVWTIFSVDFEKIAFRQVVQRLRYLAIPLICPWVVFGLLLSVIMIKEIALPNTNFILSNIDWADYKEAGGLWGLWLPRVFGRERKVIEGRTRQPIVVRNKINKDDQSMQWKQRDLFTPAANTFGLAQWIVAIFDGRATFSEVGSRSTTAGGKKGATNFGFTSAEWVETREIALELDLIRKKGNKNVLTGVGVEALAGIVRRTWPNEDKVPPGYRDLAASEEDEGYEDLPY